MELNNECAAAIDKAISDGADYMTREYAPIYDFDTALAEVIDKFGAERVNAVLAHVVNNHDWDGRLSDTNKEWAKGIDVPQVDYIELKTHLTVLDGFVNHVRKEQELQQSQDTQDLPPPPDEPTIAARPPTVEELETAIRKGEPINLTDLAVALQNEKSNKSEPEKPKKAPAKKSIKGRIEADKAEKRENSDKPAPTTQKKKGENEL
jgi:hypothetical protein